ncbi:pentapeptide repeat-containing protein [Leptolyngbya ohadii]|uniref:pentapeptide repeat-containing protein n=1 Tax=Leptolyngbya ohadii TaxID=1962290 RepID=UPI000B59C0C9
MFGLRRSKVQEKCCTDTRSRICAKNSTIADKLTRCITFKSALHRAILRRTILRRTILRRAILHRAILHRAILHRAALYLREALETELGIARPI